MQSISEGAGSPAVSMVPPAPWVPVVTQLTTSLPRKMLPVHLSV